MKAGARRRLAAAGWVGALGACASPQSDERLPPTEGLPYLGHRFEVQTAVAAQACASRGAPWAVQFSELVLDQSADRVTVTFSASGDDAVRDVVLHGCVVGSVEAGFDLRLTGSARSGVTQGSSTCQVRLSLPADLGEEIDRAEAEADLSGASTTSLGTDEEAWIAAGCPAEGADGAAAAFPYATLQVCEDGSLVGQVDGQLAWTGYACHALTPCTLVLGVEAALTESHPEAVGTEVLGGPCGDARTQR